MKIKRMFVENLNQRISGEIFFNDSLNILTGANGSGKTTFLKACWYLFSGNIKNALLEINFHKMEIETDHLIITATCDDPDGTDPIYSIELQRLKPLTTDGIDLVKSTDKKLSGTWNEIKDQVWRYSFVISMAHDSLFFPTFRRVEGGFSLGKRANLSRKNNSSVSSLLDNTDDELTKALKTTSAALTEMDNKFICSMSTADVEKLVSDAKSSMDTNQKEKYEILAKQISTDIRKWQNSGESTTASAEYLRKIFTQVTGVEKERDRIVEPMKLLNSQVAQYFPNRLIKVNQQRLGEGSQEIAADSLSAGEKQLLSFLCYAALHQNSIYMVDEPELSLHLDWQRKLISSLTDLGPTHQYFFVTHSPAIYTKFADSEISFDQFVNR